MTTLYDNFRTKTNIIINGFKDTGIIEVAERARNNTLIDEEETDSNESAQDPFDSFSESELN